MNMPRTKTLLVLGAAAMATLIAGDAAQAQRRMVLEGTSPGPRRGAPEAYNTQANPNYRLGPRVRVQPNDVVSGESIIGRDPDPFIRGELLRHYHSGWPDPI
jgi:hypothetical protein